MNPTTADEIFSSLTNLIKAAKEAAQELGIEDAFEDAILTGLGGHWIKLEKAGKATPAPYYFDKEND